MPRWPSPGKYATLALSPRAEVAFPTPIMMPYKEASRIPRTCETRIGSPSEPFSVLLGTPVRHLSLVFIRFLQHHLGSLTLSRRSTARLGIFGPSVQALSFEVSDHGIERPGSAFGRRPKPRRRRIASPDTVEAYGGYLIEPFVGAPVGRGAPGGGGGRSESFSERSARTASRCGSKFALLIRAVQRSSLPRA